MNASFKVSLATLAVALAVGTPAKADYVITKEKAFPSVAFVEFDPEAEPKVVKAPKETASVDDPAIFKFPEKPTASTGMPALIEGVEKAVKPVVDSISGKAERKEPAAGDVDQRVESRVSELEKGASQTPEMPPLETKAPSNSTASSSTSSGFVLQDAQLRTH